MDQPRFAQAEMIVLFAAKFHRLRLGHDLAVAHEQLPRLVMIQRMAALLCFKAHDERTVTGDIDGADVIHLDRNIERHDNSLKVRRFGWLNLVGPAIPARASLWCSARCLRCQGEGILRARKWPRESDPGVRSTNRIRAKALVP